jgi:aminoglycoside phosphotransferase (APT) family kinase protein
MIPLLVDLQRQFLGRADDLLALGLPDWRAAPLTRAITDVVARNPVATPALDRFVATLPDRFAAIAACGIPDTLVHGDFHPGNLRGDGDNLTLLDWGDSGVGHPLLDQPAFLERARPEERDDLVERWNALWSAAIPGADPARAAILLAPVAAARQAVIYQSFLDRIEPAERRYHVTDPRRWLLRTLALLGDD